MEMRAIIQGGSTIASLGERILGRTTLEDVVDKDGNVIAPVGTLLDEPTTQRIEDAEVQSVKIRSRSEEHTSELQSLMRISYAVFCLQKKKTMMNDTTTSQYKE